jgi:hypothetical protein
MLGRIHVKGIPMNIKRALMLTVAVAAHLAAHADTLPARLTGTWSTSATPETDRAAHNEIYLEADGFGAAVGSAPAVRLANGVDDGTPAPRAVLGFPLRASSDGDALTLHAFPPNSTAAEQAAKAARLTIACRYDPGAAALACTGPDGKAFIMHRHSETVPDDVARVIASVRAQLPTP